MSFSFTFILFYVFSREVNAWCGGYTHKEVPYVYRLSYTHNIVIFSVGFPDKFQIICTFPFNTVKPNKKLT